jgi:ppGpp synthetase/RelA/SpoT-type nucleotidyltranferase
MRDTLGLETITNKLEKSIKTELDKCGLMYRLFSRVKSSESITNKIEKKDYRNLQKKITDIIGIRITLYFKDDVELVYKTLKAKPNFDHESTDPHSIDEFKPIRCNLTFNLNEEYLNEAKTIISDDLDVVDTKYEVQIRTVLSEGWHEVEHDLRYKCKDDWNGHDDLNRNLNGIFATLETSEFSMLQMFENLAYRHYKENKIEPLIKTKYRVRLKNEVLNDELKKLLATDKELLKRIFRIDRKKFFSSFLKSKIRIPLTLENLVLLINHFEIKDPRIREFESDFVKGEFELN